MARLISMRSSLPLATLILSMLLLSGCFTEKAIEFKSIRELRPETVGKETILTMEVVFYNPNNWGCTVQHTTADLLIDGKKIGTTTQLTSVRLPAKSETVIPCAFKTSLPELLKLAPTGIGALLGINEPMATTKGTAKVRKFIFTKRIPFEVKQPIDRKFLQRLF